MALPQKIKHWLHLWSRNPNSRYIPKRFKVRTWLDICMLVFIATSCIITKVLIAQLCLTLCDPMSCNLPDCPWNSPGKEYWSGLPCPFPGDLPDPGIEPGSLMSPTLEGRFFTTIATWVAAKQNYCLLSLPNSPKIAGNVLQYFLRFQVLVQFCL